MSLIQILKGMELPTKIRNPDPAEWQICKKVFGDTLPLRQRVLITNAYGLGQTKFTIPTAAITAVGMTAASVGLTAVTLNPLVGILGSGIAYLQSFISYAYMINVGPIAEKTMVGVEEPLLVHEMVHVWQGYNGIFSMDYIISSFGNQCKGIISSGSFNGRNQAYGNPKVIPNGTWRDMNAEEQAKLVEYWFVSEKMSKSSPRWSYIKYFIREGTDTGEFSEIEGFWEVTTNGNIFYYWIMEDGYCKWFSKKPGFLSKYSSYDGEGHWEIKGSRIEIKWTSGSFENWFLPISGKAQKGNWTTKKGAIYPIHARKI